jgi:hypothetical protein
MFVEKVTSQFEEESLKGKNVRCGGDEREFILPYLT